jgi:hypothetical protein
MLGRTPASRILRNGSRRISVVRPTFNAGSWPLAAARRATGTLTPRRSAASASDIVSGLALTVMDRRICLRMALK